MCACGDQVDKCLCQVYSQRADTPFGGCSCLLFGSWLVLSCCSPGWSLASSEAFFLFHLQLIQRIIDFRFVMKPWDLKKNENTQNRPFVLQFACTRV